jgi:hypothetical protein
MKSAVWVVAVALLASGAASAAVVNFDDLSGSGAVADGYGGINWGGVWTYYDSPQPPYTPSSGLERVYTPGTGSGEYTFSFVTPDQLFNGAWFAGTDTTTVEFNLYNDGSLVWTSASLGTTSTPTFLSSGYSGAVDVVGVFSNANDFYVMDDVTYGGDVTAAPEPATMSLVLVSLVGLGVLRRRAYSPQP